MIHTTLRYALALSLCATLGCRDDDSDQDRGPASQLEIQSACQNYCEKARVCDEAITINQCITDCREAVSSCPSDDQRPSVNDLNRCSMEGCDDFSECSIGTGLQCAFGI